MPTAFRARVVQIGELQQLKRTDKPDIFKILVDFNLENSKEIFFGEVRNGGIKILEREGVNVGDLVEVTINFEGASRPTTNNKFNNLVISKIKVLEE